MAQAAPDCAGNGEHTADCDCLTAIEKAALLFRTLPLNNAITGNTPMLLASSIQTDQRNSRDIPSPIMPHRFGGYTLLIPEIGGTDNAPVLTFKRGEYESSGGVITSKYSMDFTRSFNIEGSVEFAERDGVSFALHTTAGKKSYGTDFNTCMLAPNLMNTWPKSTPNFTVSEFQNDITNGLLWDFMQFPNQLNYYEGRFYKGAYSYRIQDTTSIQAFPDDDATGNGALGIKNYGSLNQDGDFKLLWRCTNAASATGKLTLTMGGTTFTYSDLNASEVFGSLTAAKSVYFSLSTWLPAFATDSGTETKTQTQIAIDNAYYTDTGDGTGSTLGVETYYYIDTDDNGSFETSLRRPHWWAPTRLCWHATKFTIATNTPSPPWT